MLWIELIETNSVIHSCLTVPWHMRLSPRSSWKCTLVSTWNRRRVHRMVKHCTLTSTSIFLVLTVLPSRLLIQKEIYKPLTMMVTGKSVIGTSMSHSTRNNREPYRLWWQWHGQYHQSLPLPQRQSRVLSWRQQSILSGPNQRSMKQISIQLCLIWVKWSQRKA